MPSPAFRYARYAGVAFEFSGTIAGAAVAGWWLDRWLGTAPYVALVFILIGSVGGLLRLVQILRRFDRLDRGAES